MTDTTTTAPDDEPTAAEMAAFNSFDPVNDVPSPVQVTGDARAFFDRIGAEPTLQALNPELRHAAEARLAGLPWTPEAERAAVLAVLRDNSREFRIKAGAGEGATETQRTMLQQANQIRQLAGEYERIKTLLAEVREFRNEVDDTGKPTPVPVYVSEGDSRRALEARLDEVGREMALIAGIQGDRELKEANRADALQARKTRQQIADHREASRRAAKMAREDHINRMARTKAKFLGDTNL